TEPTTGQKPTLKLNIQNGRRVLRFDAVNDNLSFSIVNLNAFTVFVVFAASSSVHNVGPIYWRTDNTVAGFNFVANATAGTIYNPGVVVYNGTAETVFQRTSLPVGSYPVPMKLYAFDSGVNIWVNTINQALSALGTGWPSTGGGVI